MLHAVFIVIEVIDFFKSIDDAGLYFLGSLFFEGGNFSQQMCDIPDFLSKQFLQHEAFLGNFEFIRWPMASSTAFFTARLSSSDASIVSFFNASGNNVWATDLPVRICSDTVVCFQSFIIILDNIGIEFGIAICRNFVFYLYRKIDFASFEPASYFAARISISNSLYIWYAHG